MDVDRRDFLITLGVTTGAQSLRSSHASFGDRKFRGLEHSPKGGSVNSMSTLPTYEIQVLKAGEADVPGPEVYWMSHWDTWETLSFYIVIIRGNGRTLVINTGPPRDLSLLNAAWKDAYGVERAAMRRTDRERPEFALQEAGVNPGEVDYVVVTPLQAYATANIPLFSKATICISKRGWIEDFHAPPFPVPAPRHLRIPNDVLVYLETEAWDRVRLLDEEEEIMPGIKAFWVGAHHRSSIAVSVMTTQGPVVISDCFFKYPNVDQNIPLGVQESMEQCMLAYARIRKEAAVVIPLYDPEVLKRHPGGRIV